MRFAALGALACPGRPGTLVGELPTIAIATGCWCTVLRHAVLLCSALAAGLRHRSGSCASGTLIATPRVGERRNHPSTGSVRAAHAGITTPMAHTRIQRLCASPGGGSWDGRAGRSMRAPDRSYVGGGTSRRRPSVCTSTFQCLVWLLHAARFLPCHRPRDSAISRFGALLAAISRWRQAEWRWAPNARC